MRTKSYVQLSGKIFKANEVTILIHFLFPGMWTWWLEHKQPYYEMRQQNKYGYTTALGCLNLLLNENKCSSFLSSFVGIVIVVTVVIVICSWTSCWYTIRLNCQGSTHTFIHSISTFTFVQHCCNWFVLEMLSNLYSYDND